MTRSPFVPEGVSPLPWRPQDRRILADDDRWTIVCEALGSPENPEVRADLAFIAHACSAYQELAEALEEAVEHMPDVTTYQRERVRRVEALLQRCREFAERGGR